MMPCVWRTVAALVVVAVTLPSPTLTQTDDRCIDRAARCPLWASRGSCSTSPAEMSAVCPFSCRVCHPGVQHPPERPGGGAGDRPAPGLRPRPTRPRPLPPRSSITRPNFECGGAVNSITTNTRRARSAHPQLTPHTREDDLQTPDVIPAGESPSHEAPRPFCGATPISPNFLLTSATCVIDPDRPVYSVRLGELDFTKDNETNSRPIDYAIKQIIVHPDFNPYTGVRYNDVALLQTDRPIVFNKYVFPYCLSDQTPPPNTLVTGSGFGHVNETHKAGHLQEAELEVLPNKACEDTYREAGQEQRLKAAYPFLLGQRDVLCAGYPGRGACKGDEGGPLFREDSAGRRYLVGIISFTGPCAKDDILPGVYTDVATHIHFINSVLYGV